jgi:hypothetical protein
MISNELKAIYFISLKDIKSYYFKPPNISWGIIFPVAMALAFYLRNPTKMIDLIPGLLVMTILFGATSMEGVLAGKILGGRFLVLWFRQPCSSSRSFSSPFRASISFS